MQLFDNQALHLCFICDIQGLNDLRPQPHGTQN